MCYNVRVSVRRNKCFMKIKISTDSTCDLPSELIAAHDMIRECKVFRKNTTRKAGDFSRKQEA